MTVTTLDITSGPYVGNGASDEYSYTFRIKDKTQLSIYETTNLGVTTLLTVDVDYTVNSVGVDTGGTITRLAGNLPTDYTWYIRSNYIENQLTAFASQGAFFPDVHENQMDHLTFLIQQQLDLINRSFRLDESVNIDGVFTLTQNAAARAGLFLVFNAAGDLALASGTGNDSSLRTDLASADSGKGASLVKFASGSTVQDVETGYLHYSAATYASATTFTVLDVTSFHVGRRVKTSEGAYGVITGVSGTTITVDLSSGSLTASLASVQLGPAADGTSSSIRYFRRSQVERDAGITPTDYTYEWGNVRRYGAVGDHNPVTGIGTDDSAAFQRAIGVQTYGKARGDKLKFPAGQFLIENELAVPYQSGGIVWEGSGAYESNPYTTDRYGPQTILYWGGVAGGTLIKSTGTLNHIINNMTLVGRKSVSANRAGILLHSKWQSGYSNAHVHLTNVMLYDADVAMQFADVSTDGNSSDCLFDMVSVFSCDTGLLVKNTQGLNYIFNLYGVDSCKRAIHFEQGGSLTVNGMNLSNSGGTGINDWCILIDNFGDSSGNAQINNLRLEQNTKQILKAANLGNIQINGLYEAQGNQAVTMYELNGVSLTMRDSRIITNDSTNPAFSIAYGGGSQMPSVVIEDTHFDVSSWIQNNWFGFPVTSNQAALHVNRSFYADNRQFNVPLINSRLDSGPVTLFVQTTDANITNVTFDGSATSNVYNVCRIPTDTAWILDLYFIGMKTDGTDTASFHRRATVKNVGGTTSQVGSTVTVGTDENTPAWSVGVNITDAYDGVRPQVTGATSTTIDWGVNVVGTRIK